MTIFFYFILNSCYHSNFYLYGRKGIFIILSLILILSLVMTSLFMINYATAVAPLIEQIIDLNDFLVRLGIVIASGVMLFWFWVQRDIYNLRYASYTALMWIIAFISILLLISYINFRRFTFKLGDIVFPKSIEYNVLYQNYFAISN